MLRIAVITGGESSEREISLQSAQTIFDNLSGNRIQPYMVHLDTGNWHVKLDGEEYPIDKNDFSFEQDARRITFDAAFLSIHGHPAEDGILQAYFDLIKLPCTGCSAHVSALTFDKIATKRYLVENQGYKMAKDLLLRNDGSLYDHLDRMNQLTLPVFVKPNQNGSSYGISKVDNQSDLMGAVEKAFQFDDEVLIEEFIEGVEVTCGLYQVNNEITTLPLTEIRPKTEFFDYEAKYKGASDEITPATISERLTTQCKNISVEIYKTLNCRGLVRIDYILKGEEFYLLEVNTIPGMSAASLVPQQVEAAGKKLKDVFGSLVGEALRAKNKSITENTDILSLE